MSDQLPSIPIGVATELVRQGEVRLSSILTIALAADVRANTLCNTFGTVAVAVGAAVLAELTSDHPVQRLVIPGTIVTAGLLISALVSAFAGKPQGFLIPGGDPAELRKWSWTGSDWRSETELLDATAARYAKAIASDAAVLKKGSNLIHIALTLALASLMAALAVFCLLKSA